MRDTIAAYPLQWPAGWKRTPAEALAKGKFSKAGTTSGNIASNDYRHIPPRDVTISEATQRMLRELERLGVQGDDVVLSSNLRLRLDGLPISNQAEPSDPAAAVYWRDKGTTRCMAIDRYTKVAQNIAALAATIEAMRAIERHGGAVILERAFTGFAALPAPSNWRQVLGVAPTASKDEVQHRYRIERSKHHPDNGGEREKFFAIEQAWQQALRELT